MNAAVVTSRPSAIGNHTPDDERCRAERADVANGGCNRVLVPLASVFLRGEKPLHDEGTNVIGEQESGGDIENGAHQRALTRCLWRDAVTTNARIEARG